MRRQSAVRREKTWHLRTHITRKNALPEGVPCLQQCFPRAQQCATVRSCCLSSKWFAIHYFPRLHTCIVSLSINDEAGQTPLAHRGKEGWLQTQFQLDVDIVRTLSLPLSSSNREGAGVGDPIEYTCEPSKESMQKNKKQQHLRKQRIPKLFEA